MASNNSEITKWPAASGYYWVQRAKDGGMLLRISKEWKAENYFLNFNRKAEMLSYKSKSNHFISSGT